MSTILAVSISYWACEF